MKGDIWSPEGMLAEASGPSTMDALILRGCQETLLEVPSTVSPDETSWTRFDPVVTPILAQIHCDRAEALRAAREWLDSSMDQEPEDDAAIVHSVLALGLWSLITSLQGIGSENPSLRTDGALGMSLALELHRAAPMTSSYALLLEWSAPILRSLDRPAQGLWMLRGAFHVQYVLTEIEPAGLILASIAGHHAKTGDLHAAVDHLHAALRLLPEGHRFRPACYLNLAWYQRALGQTTLLSSYLGIAESGSQAVRARVEWLRGLLRLDAQDLKYAVFYLRQAHRSVQDCEASLVILITLDLVRALYRAGESRQIQGHWDAVEPLLVALSPSAEEAVTGCFDAAIEHELVAAEFARLVVLAQLTINPTMRYLVGDGESLAQTVERKFQL